MYMSRHIILDPNKPIEKLGLHLPRTDTDLDLFQCCIQAHTNHMHVDSEIHMMHIQFEMQLILIEQLADRPDPYNPQVLA